MARFNPENTIWLIAGEKAEGSAVAVRLQKKGDPQTARTYLLTCAHVVKEAEESGDTLRAWPPKVGRTEELARSVRVKTDIKDLPSGRRNPADDWVILQIVDDQASMAAEAIGVWASSSLPGDYRIWGYMGGTASLQEGITRPTRAAAFPFRSEHHGDLRLTGDGTRPGASGGGLFGETDGCFAGIHRARFDEAQQLSAVSAPYILRRLFEVGYEPSVSSDGVNAVSVADAPKHRNAGPSSPRPRDISTLQALISALSKFHGLQILFGVVAVLAIALQLSPASRVTDKIPKIVLIDSFPRRYDPSSPVTNAHEIEKLLDQIAAGSGRRVDAEHILVGKTLENYDQVIQKHPDLVIIHMSAFFLSTNDSIDLQQFDEAMHEFRNFVEYLLENDKNTQLLVYTRQPPTAGKWTPTIREHINKNFEEQKLFILSHSRVDLLVLPWNAKFNQSEVINSMKSEIRKFLEKIMSVSRLPPGIHDYDTILRKVSARSYNFAKLRLFSGKDVPLIGISPTQLTQMLAVMKKARLRAAVYGSRVAGPRTYQRQLHEVLADGMPIESFSRHASVSLPGIDRVRIPKDAIKELGFDHPLTSDLSMAVFTNNEDIDQIKMRACQMEQLFNSKNWLGFPVRVYLTLHGRKFRDVEDFRDFGREHYIKKDLPSNHTFTDAEIDDAFSMLFAVLPAEAIA